MLILSVSFCENRTLNNILHSVTFPRFLQVFYNLISTFGGSLKTERIKN